MANGGVLPEDLVIDILSWLPVKSLMRFKCVCKLWRSLFKNPAFITKHLNNDRDDCIFLEGIDKASRKHVFSLLRNETLDVIENLDFPYLNDYKGVNVVGCCHGILCAKIYDIHGFNADIILWNPATREMKFLPQSNVLRPYSNMSATFGLLGFGFDAKSIDYKVVHLVILTKDSAPHVELYDLSTNSWRKSDAVVAPGLFFNTLCLYDNGTYMNGTCYWLAKVCGCDHHIILSFDISKQVFKTILLPYAWAVKPKRAPENLCVVNESIAVILDLHVEGMNDMYEVWVMNEYCVKESWTKLYSSEPIPKLWRTLGYWKNGCLFAEQDGGQLVLLNPDTQEMKDLQFGSIIRMSINFYKESLVPLDGF